MDDPSVGAHRGLAARTWEKTRREAARWNRRFTDRLPELAAPVPLGRDPIELHTLACARDVPMSLWSLSSFVAQSGLRPRVVVHDDGTLTEAHRRTYRAHFEGIVVLDDAASSTRMEQALAPWPTCRRLRGTPGFFCARKLFDPLFFADSDPILYVDSDVLFFRRPDRLLEHARAGRACFSSDYQDAYAMPRSEIQRVSGRGVEGCVNSGLLCIPVERYREQMDLLERFLAHAVARQPAPDVNRHEQTAHALLQSCLGAARLPPDYAIGDRIDPRATSHHFVGEGRGRKRFWRRGVPRIRRGVTARLAGLALQPAGASSRRR